MAQGTVCNVDGRGRHLGQTTQTPHGPEGVAQCKRTAGSAEPAASRPCMVIGWRGGQTTQTPHGPEGGGAVQTHCRLSRASREQTPYGYRVGGQTTQTPEGPEGGGAVQTHCRLSRASRQQTPYGNGVGCGCGHVWKAEREHVCVWCVCVVWQERVYFKMPNVPCPNVPMSSIVQCPMSQCNVPMMSQCPMSQCPYVPSH